MSGGDQKRVSAILEYKAIHKNSNSVLQRTIHRNKFNSVHILAAKHWSFVVKISAYSIIRFIIRNCWRQTAGAEGSPLTVRLPHPDATMIYANINIMCFQSSAYSVGGFVSSRSTQIVSKYTNAGNLHDLISGKIYQQKVNFFGLRVKLFYSSQD
jgi:hypothetical protein